MKMIDLRIEYNEGYNITAKDAQATFEYSYIPEVGITVTELPPLTTQGEQPAAPVAPAVEKQVYTSCAGCVYDCGPHLNPCNTCCDGDIRRNYKPAAAVEHCPSCGKLRAELERLLKDEVLSLMKQQPTAPIPPQWAAWISVNLCNRCAFHKRGYCDCPKLCTVDDCQFQLSAPVAPAVSVKDDKYKLDEFGNITHNGGAIMLEKPMAPAVERKITAPDIPAKRPALPSKCQIIGCKDYDKDGNFCLHIGACPHTMFDAPPCPSCEKLREENEKLMEQLANAEDYILEQSSQQKEKE